MVDFLALQRNNFGGSSFRFFVVKPLTMFVIGSAFWWHFRHVDDLQQQKNWKMSWNIWNHLQCANNALPLAINENRSHRLVHNFHSLKSDNATHRQSATRWTCVSFFPLHKSKLSLFCFTLRLFRQHFHAKCFSYVICFRFEKAFTLNVIQSLCVHFECAN